MTFSTYMIVCIYIQLRSRHNADYLFIYFFNATFSNISAISWRPVLVVEAGVPGENHRPWTSNDIAEILLKLVLSTNQSKVINTVQ